MVASISAKPKIDFVKKHFNKIYSFFKEMLKTKLNWSVLIKTLLKKLQKNKFLC